MSLWVRVPAPPGYPLTDGEPISLSQGVLEGFFAHAAVPQGIKLMATSFQTVKCVCGMCGCAGLNVKGLRRQERWWYVM